MRAVIRPLVSQMQQSCGSIDETPRPEMKLPRWWDDGGRGDETGKAPQQRNLAGGYKYLPTAVVVFVTR